MCEVVVWEFKTGMFTGVVGWDVKEHVCSEERASPSLREAGREGGV